jgi:hypothetical protein
MRPRDYLRELLVERDDVPRSTLSETFSSTPSIADTAKMLPVPLTLNAYVSPP